MKPFTFSIFQGWKGLLLLVFGGVLMALGFAPYNFILGPFIGIVPLLALEVAISKRSGKKAWRTFGAAYLYFAVFNFSTIWWVKNASWVGVIASVVVNSFFFALLIVFYGKTKRVLSPKAGYIAFVSFWLGWEYIEFLDWDLSWPWLTVGHVFGNWPALVQWYSYFGVLSGSAWVLIVNLILFLIVQSLLNKADAFERFKLGMQLAFVVIVPVLISLVQYFTYDEKGIEQEIVVLQPNMDPYSDRFMNSEGKELPGLTNTNHIKKFISLAEQEVKASTNYLLLHETALPVTEDNYSIQKSESLGMLQSWRDSKFPDLSILTGLAYRNIVPKSAVPEPLPPTFKRNRYTGEFYEYFNSSVFLNNQKDSIAQYHKSRLVIGVERIPSYFVYLQRYLTDFDSDAGASVYNPNNGVQTNREVFYGRDSSSIIAPIICYESVFGDYVGDYVLKGATILGIITNDAWWGNTAGHQQHWSFARLRAIETRRSVARSANTGISGFIDQRGDVIVKSEYLKPAVLKATVKANTKLSFYVRFGDIIGKVALGLGITILLNLIVKSVVNKPK